MTDELICVQPIDHRKHNPKLCEYAAQLMAMNDLALGAIANDRGCGYLPTRPCICHSSSQVLCERFPTRHCDPVALVKTSGDTSSK